MRKFNIFFPFLLFIFFLPIETNANVKNPLFETWVSGKYFQFKNKHIEYLKEFKKEDKKYNKIDYIFQLGQEASHHLDSKVLDFCYSELKKFFDNKEYGGLSKILYDALQITDIRFTKESRLLIIANYNFVKPFSLSSEQRVIFFQNIIDLYLEDQNFKEAERYLFLSAALTAKDPNFNIDLLLGHLSRSLLINTVFGRTSNLKEIDESIWKLLNKNKNFIGKAANHTSFSHIANAYLGLDKKEELDRIFLIIQNYRENTIDIPLKAEISLLFTENLLNASKGITTNPSKYLKIVSDKFNVLNNVNYLKKFVISFTKFTKIYTKVISDEIITKDDYDFSLRFDLLGENLDIYKKLIELTYFSQKNDKFNFEIKFSELEEVLSKISIKASSIFDFDKQKLSLDTLILEITLKNYVRIYGNEVKPNFIRKFFKIFNNDKTEIDFYSKIKRSKGLQEDFLLIKANNFLKLNKEIDYLYGRLINLLVDNGIQQINRNFKHKQIKRDYKLYTDFLTILKKQRSDFKNIENVSQNAFSKSIFSNDLDLKKIQSKLNEKEALFFYNLSDNYIFRCFVRNTKSKCFINEYKIDFIKKINDFRNEILYSKKDKIFKSELSFKFFELFFSGFNFNNLDKIIIKPNQKHLALPFNVLKSKNWKKNEYLGLKFSLSLLPTFNLQSNIYKIKHDKKYLGVGNPKYYSEKNAEEKFSQLFTLRSVDNANELSKLSDLPETKFEILNSSKSFRKGDKSILLGNKATELNLRLLNLSEYKIIHFATHGLVSGDFSGLKLPSLALSYDNNSKYELTDGLLNSIEISELSLNAKLVILSACQTVNDAGKVNSGFNGLASAFLNAGAEEVIATQWKIESLSASKFISHYVNQISKENAITLNNSLQQTINEKNYNHPFFWAPYIKISSLKNNNNIISESSKKIISSYFSDKDRIEYTNLKKFENEVWLTFYKIRFGDFFATNYLAKLKDNKIIQFKSPFGSLKIVEIKKNKIILSGSIKNNKKQTIPVIITFDKNNYKFKILEKFNKEKFEIGLIKNIFKDNLKKTAVIITYQNESGEKQKNYFVDFDENFKISKVKQFYDRNNLAVDKKFFKSGPNIFKIEEIMTLSNNLYDFKNGRFFCDERKFALYKINNDKESLLVSTIKGDYLNYISTKKHKVILFQKKCDDFGLFTYNLRNGKIKKLVSAPINFGEVFQIESKKGLYLAGHLSIQASVLGRFNKNIIWKDNHLAW